MNMFRPATLPEFLDPLLASLPDPLYQIAVSFLSNLIALLSAIYDITSSIISADSSKWDAQKLLPPIITLLAAYLALLSLYRTTTWVFRSTFFFLKWGGLISLMLGSAVYMLGSNNSSSYVNAGTLSTAGSLLWSFLNKPNNHRNSNRGTSRSSSGQTGERPSVWESFDRHREWRDRAPQQQPQSQSNDIVQDIMDIASKYVGVGGIGGVFEAVMGALDQPQEESGDLREGSSRKSSRKANSHSR